jgi:hypothetical protein
MLLIALFHALEGGKIGQPFARLQIIERQAANSQIDTGLLGQPPHRRWGGAYEFGNVEQGNLTAVWTEGGWV